MKRKRVVIEREVIDGLLTYCRELHPREGILLLRGRSRSDEIRIDGLVIPPLAVHSETYSTFPVYMLPFDLSILGTAHSHPNGVLEPSLDDLNNYYGRVMIIVGYPYESEDDVALFDKDGNRAIYHIV